MQNALQDISEEVIRMADKVLCPWCGAEMEIKTARHDVPGIIYARGAKKRECRWNAWASCSNDDCGADGPIVVELETEQEAIEAARAAALRRYTPPLRPMTLPEVRRESSAWLEVRNKGWKLRFVEMTKRSGGVVFRPAGSKELHGVLYDTYNKDWRCWSRKPTEEERSAAEWE